MQTWPGKLIAVCQYPDATGDIVLIDSETEAEATCSADGTLTDSRVLRVVRLPSP